MEEPVVSGPEPAVPEKRVHPLPVQQRDLTLLGAGVLIAFILLILYNASQPPPPRLTKRDVDVAVARALASATPPPPNARRVYEAIRPSVVQVRASVVRNGDKPEAGRGAGVVLDEMGNILTSLHVVRDATDIQVIFADGSQSKAQVVVKQPENDIAVLRPDVIPDDIQPATMGNPNALQVGDDAFVIGNPFGLTGSLTSGVVSGLHRSFVPPEGGTPLNNLIQFDAAVNPGNSGGPLLDRDGEVVGIVTALLNPTEQNVFIGIGFAVPIDVAAAAVGTPPY